METCKKLIEKISKEQACNNKHKVDELMTLKEVLDYFSKPENNLYKYLGRRTSVEMTHEEVLKFSENWPITKQKIWDHDGEEIVCLIDKWDIFGNYYVEEKVMFEIKDSYVFLENERKELVRELMYYEE